MTTMQPYCQQCDLLMRWKRNDRTGECYRCPGCGAESFLVSEGGGEADLHERLAAYAHDAWSRWMRHLCNRAGGNDDLRYSGRILLTSMNDAERWARQMGTPYAELPEAERASDRAEADRILAILRGEG